MLSVVVTDGDGAPVAGHLAMPGSVAFVGAFETVTLDKLRFLAWSPEGILTPGTYTAKIDVSRPTVAYDTWACNFQDFERIVTFTVVAEPVSPPSPQLALEFSLHTYQDVRWDVGCGDDYERFVCEDQVTSCCVGPQAVRFVQFKTTASVVGLGATHAAYYALILEMDDPNRPAQKVVRVEPLGGSTGPFTSVLAVLARDGVAPVLVQMQLCSRAVLVDLTTGAATASASDCVDTAEPTLYPSPPITQCDPGACSELAEPPPATEPSPEPIPEAGAELTSASGDTTSNSAERPDDTDGCGAGGPIDVAALVAALTLLAWRRRTSRVLAACVGGLLLGFLAGVPAGTKRHAPKRR